MDQCGTRFVERLPAIGIELQAKINVVECYWEFLLVETADGQEFLPRNDKACTCHRADATIHHLFNASRLWHAT